MRHQPTRTLRNPNAHEEDHDADPGADQESEPPTIFGMQHGRVEHDDGAGRARRRPDPEAAVDQKIGPAPHPRRDEFLNGGVDRRVFAADPRSGQEAKRREAPHVPREGGRAGGAEIHPKRNEKQLLAAEPVGQPAEENGAKHRAGEIGAGGEAHIAVGEMQDRAFLQRAGERAGERHFQPIENPGDPERDHDERVKPAPRQPIEPRGNVGFHDGATTVDTTLRLTRRVIDFARRFSRRRLLDISRVIDRGRRLLDRARLVGTGRRFVDRQPRRIRAALRSVVRQQGAVVAHAVFVCMKGQTVNRRQRRSFLRCRRRRRAS